jgi:hypothetical protein
MNKTNNPKILDVIITMEEVSNIISGNKKTIFISNEVSIYQIDRVNIHAERYETYVSALITNIEYTDEGKILTIRPEMIMF